MNLFRSTLKGLAMRLAAFGRNSGMYSWMSLLSGSGVSWGRKAGPRYDNSAVMAIIQYLAGAVESGPRLIVERPVRGKKGREWREADDHPFVDTVEDGPVMTMAQLTGGAILSLVVEGNAYWIKLRSNSNQVIGYIYVPHWQMQPRNDKAYGNRAADGTHLVTYYQFSGPDGSQMDLLPEDVVHFRWGIDPGNLAKGMSPLGAALREICTDNECATVGHALLERGGVLGWAISPDKIGDFEPEVNPEKMREMARAAQSHMTGDMAGTPVPLPYPIKVTQLGFEPSKLVLDKQRSMAVERIMSQYGIDPMVLGLPSQSKTFSNFEEANEAAVRRGVMRVLFVLSSTLTKQVLRVDFNTNVQRYSLPRVGWDLSEVAALQEDRDKLHNRVRSDWQGDLITRAEGRLELGYGVSGLDDDVFYSQWKAGFVVKPIDDKAKEDKVEKARLLRDARRQMKALEAAIDA